MTINKVKHQHQKLNHVSTMRLFKIFPLVLLLSACGGSSGGGDSGSAGSANFQTPVAISTFQPLVGASTSFPIMDLYIKDLNKDGVDEIIIAGRKTQPATVMNWQNFNMQIYGWNTGTLTNETATWFSGSDNVLIGSEPSVKFGDFDGDTNIDMVVAASTDMDVLKGETVVYHNNGSNTFTKSVLSVGMPWSHDSLVFDFNGDGRDDIMVSDYGTKTSISYGKTDDTFDSHVSNDFNGSASGLSAGDYLNNGTIKIMITDNGADPNQDTKLMNWATNAGVLTMSENKLLVPMSIFSQPEWADEVAASAYGAHAIRNIAMDFNGDTVTDLVVFDRLDNYSVVQFLLNDGSGNFSDVTSTTLLNYVTTNGGVNYQPVLADFNGDGLTDIFLSGNDFSQPYDATQILVQSSDGKYVGSYVNVFAALHTTIQAGLTNPDTGGQNMHIAKGPNSEYYIVTNGVFNDNGTYKSTFYAAKIGAMTARATQTATELQNNVWPYPQ